MVTKSVWFKTVSTSATRSRWQELACCHGIKEIAVKELHKETNNLLIPRHDKPQQTNVDVQLPSRAGFVPAFPYVLSLIHTWSKNLSPALTLRQTITRNRPSWIWTFRVLKNKFLELSAPPHICSILMSFLLSPDPALWTGVNAMCSENSFG